MKKDDLRRIIGPKTMPGPRDRGTAIRRTPMPSSFLRAKEMEKYLKKVEIEKKQEVTIEYALIHHCKVLIRYTEKGKAKAINGIVHKVSYDEIEVSTL